MSSISMEAWKICKRGEFDSLVILIYASKRIRFESLGHIDSRKGLKDSILTPQPRRR